ncbi:XkdF-like putative serine protease domain-containing protein [Bradyrhizobium sp. CCBAU 51753]|uniref:XkdF-like putative serine protease domain-containing protein n=1 Tax=Bradyrhizobium sp. CCBAU 51753 TaxID=1325100 RepID=UPI001AED4002|nr:XkdF-like putative serine protease domain-containing protein [Bradyrhizobium sp. CCBAU 51753]
MPFTTANQQVIAKFLPAPALEVFCKAATQAEQDNKPYNDCVKAGWTAVGAAGWQKPATGKKWIRKDDPGGSSVHVDAPLGGARKKPKAEDDMTEKFDTEASVFKVDDSLGLVFGWAIVCNKAGEAYYDTQGDHIPEDSMLKAAADFMKNSRVAKDMHQGDEIGPVVFAWPMTAEIAKAMGIETETTGLMIAMLPPADILAKFKDGSYTGFSIGGDRVHDEEVAA